MSIVYGTSRRISRYPFDGIAANVVLPVPLEGDKGLKRHAQVRHSLEDGPLLEYLLDAIEYVESRGNVSFINQRVQHVMHSWPGGQTVQITRGPLVSVESVKYLDSAGVEQTAAASLWRADTRSRWGGIYFSDSFSELLADGDGVVWADITCGYGTVSDAVPNQWKQLVKIVATHCYERREMAAGGGFDDAFEAVLRRKFQSAGQLIRYS